MKQVSWLFFLVPIISTAQFAYRLDTSIPVQGFTQQMRQPWAGGINAVQVNTMDINHDDVDDLVLFDRMANKIITYLAKDSQYEHAPEYEILFPQDLSNFVLLRDFNADGKKDIFTGSALGIKVYKNVSSSSGHLAWRPFLFFAGQGVSKSKVLLTKGFSGKINLQLQFDDLPSIEDIDGDGDLDIITIAFSGSGAVEFHKNFSRERFGHTDSLEFERITQRWGNFTECGCGEFAFSNTACNTARIQHAGGKSLLVFDADGDRIMDLLFSESNCSPLFLLRNHGTSENAHFSEAEVFPKVFQYNGLYPIPSLEDVDFDRVKDLLVSPGVYTRSDNETSFGKSFQFYKNIATQNAPHFTFIQNNFLQYEMIDVGENAVPAFFDYDGDGDQDLFISSAGDFINGIFSSGISLFENKGSQESPSFTFVTLDFDNLSQLQFYNMRIQFVDINADGKTDLVFTATNQEGITSLYYLLNRAINLLDLNKTINTTEVVIGFTENIHVVEINNDGLYDLLVGKLNGALEYWKNTGTSEFPQWQVENPSYLGLGASVERQNLAVTTGDVNGDLKTDLVVGDQNGALAVLPDFRLQKSFSEAIEELTYNTLTKLYETQNFGGKIWPTIMNVGNTPAIVIGNSLGGIQILTQEKTETSVAVYPNPVARTETLFIQTNTKGIIHLLNAMGGKIQSHTLVTGVNRLGVSNLQSGVYLLKIVLHKEPITHRIIVTD